MVEESPQEKRKCSQEASPKHLHECMQSAETNEAQELSVLVQGCDDPGVTENRPCDCVQAVWAGWFGREGVAVAFNEGVLRKPYVRFWSERCGSLGHRLAPDCHWVLTLQDENQTSFYPFASNQML